MDNSYSKGFRDGIILIIVALSLPVALMVGGLVNSITYFNRIAEKYDFTQIEDEYGPKEALERKFELLINSGIKNDYYGFREESECNDIAAKAIMMMLNDDYAAYYTPEEAKTLLLNNLGTYKGIGITISLEASSNRCIIVNVVEDSSADKAGIKAGDLIVKINNTVAERLNTSEISKLMDEAGDTLNMTVSRNGNLLEVTVKKGLVLKKHIKHEKIDNIIGYIKLDEFTGKCVPQMKFALEELKGVKGYIIDLRGNPGGQLESAVSLVGYFTGKDKLATYLTLKNKEKEEYYTDTSSLIANNSKIVIIVNSASASASEMFTGALQDILGTRVKVVGTNTFGKGIAQEILPLSDESVIKYTVGEYFTPNGRVVNKVGIQPDIEIFNVEGEETDRQLNTAIDTLKNMLKE